MGAQVGRAAEICDAATALRDVGDGATVLVGGFGGAGMPHHLVAALRETGARGLTLVSNNAGTGRTGLAGLLQAGMVRKVICSYPRQAGSDIFDELYRSESVDLELVPQGTLAERIRAGGAGIGAFFTPTGAGTMLAAGKEVRQIDGHEQVLEYAIRGDVALVRANMADTAGNLTFRKTGRNFGPVMATAASTTVVEVSQVVEIGSIDPDAVVTPGIYVDRLVPGARVA